ncbi:hypothetical protein ACWEQL_31700 [Kitasatospora sp. NPDC004240]
MTAKRSKRIAWGLTGGAVAAILAYLSGYQASQSGGLVEVERWLNHPVPLLGTAVVLLVVSAVLGPGSRTRLWRMASAAVLAVVVAVGAVGAVSSFVLGGTRSADRKPAPNHPDRVLTVTDIAYSIDPVHHVELRTGSGWAARHWDLGTWDEGDGLRGAEWSAADQITLTTYKQTRVYTLAPDGRPGQPRITVNR